MRIRGQASESSAAMKIFLLISAVIASTIACTIIGLISAIPVFKIGIFAILNNIQKVNVHDQLNINILKYLQIWSSIGVFIIPALIIAYLFSNNAFGYLRLNKNIKLTSVILVFILVLASMPIIGWLEDLNARLILPHQLKGIEDWMKSTENEAAVLTKAFLGSTTLKGLFLNIFMIALLPAIGEEFLFRGVLLKLFKDWTHRSHLAVWLTAIVFSFIHFQFYGFVPRMMLGALLGYLCIWSGSLWLPIIAHFTNNGAAVVGAFLQNKGFIKSDLDNLFSNNMEFMYVIFSVIITSVLLMLIFNQEKKKQLEI